MKSVKYIIILFAAVMFGFTSCGNRNANKPAAHTHEDGSVCTGHAAEQAPAAQQESFKVEDDGTTSTEDPAHECSDGHDHEGHSHEGEGAHKH